MSLASLRNRKSLALVLTLTCQGSFAQGTPGDWKIVQNFAVDARIAVKMKAGEKYHRELVEVTVDSLTVDSDEAAYPGRARRRRELKRENIREIRLVAPTTFVIAGAGVGVGIGVGLDSFTLQPVKNHDSTDRRGGQEFGRSIACRQVWVYVIGLPGGQIEIR
jgi:hypothetical protein